MTEAEDIRPMDVYCKPLQFGPITRGFKCVYLAPVVLPCDDLDADDEEHFEVQVRDVGALGLVEMNWDGDFVIEPASFVLEDGDWIIANKQPGYCGTFVDDCTALEADGKVRELLLHLDPYYRKRLIPDNQTEVERGNEGER